VPPSEGSLAQAPPGSSETHQLLAILRQLSCARSQEEIMAAVTQSVRTLLQADGATFVLRDGDSCHYVEEDAISPLWSSRRLPMSACICGWSMTNRQAVAVPDIHQDPRIRADTYRPNFVRSLAAAPVRRDDPIAAVGAYWSEMHAAGPEELAILQAIADAAALAVENVQLRQTGPARRRRPADAPTREPHKSTPGARPSFAIVLDRIRREGLRPNSLHAYTFATVCIVAATLIRYAVDFLGGEGLAGFTSYFPAVLLSTLVGGRRGGIFAAVLGGLAVHYFFTPPLYELVTLSVADVVDLTLYAGACALIILIVHRYQIATVRLVREDAQHLTLAREQHHRLKNAVFVAEAVVQQSLRDQPDRARTITQRIRAGLAEVDLEQGAKDTLVLRDILVAELQPYDLARFTLEGADETLPPQARRLVTLATHELATNAIKYGALSAPKGRVTVAWRALDDRVVIRWLEADGPPVQPPHKRGFGSILLRRLIEAEGGAITTEFRPSGVMAKITLPIRPVRRS
jgi:two-component sensor histidine kinase